MLETRPREIEIYTTQNGRKPFTVWFESLRDARAQGKIEARLISLESGNLGDYKSVGGGVYELRIHVGKGYRIYFGEVDNTGILLLCGGDKSSQQRDIERAKTFWNDFKERQR